MQLENLVDQLMISMVADGLSPFPGFFRFATIAKFIGFKGYEGKGSAKRFGGQRSLSRPQLAAIKRYLDNYYEKKIDRGRIYYGRNKRR